MKHLRELALRSRLAAVTLRASNIPGIIGLHCLLLSYLISFTHVFDTQRKFRVTNECCKHKRILFLCRFFWQLLYTLGESTQDQQHGQRMKAAYSNHMSASSFILNWLGSFLHLLAVPYGSLSWDSSWYVLSSNIIVII